MKEGSTLKPRVSEKAELLRALALVCEGERPSVLLDVAIECALNPAARPCDGGARVQIGLHNRYAKPFSSSLDAAVTLVPDGWFWRLGYTPIFKGWAHVSRTHADHCDRNDEHSSTTAADPILALCDAALKARAAIAEQEQSSTKRGEANPNSPTLSKAGA